MQNIWESVSKDKQKMLLFFELPNKSSYTPVRWMTWWCYWGIFNCAIFEIKESSLNFGKAGGLQGKVKARLTGHSKLHSLPLSRDHPFGVCTSFKTTKSKKKLAKDAALWVFKSSYKSLGEIICHQTSVWMTWELCFERPQYIHVSICVDERPIVLL